LKGLEVSVVRLSAIDEFNESLRLDAEFFGKFPLHVVSRVKASSHSPVSKIVSKIQHPIEVTREYEDEGLLTIMAGNVRDNFVSLDDQRFMPEAVRSIVAKNRLKFGDVLMTRTGANFGNTAPWKHSEIEAFACADALVFREPSIPSGYLSSYLSSKAGQALIIRGGYGMAQPHIAPSYLQNMIVPRFDDLEQFVDKLVDQSNDLGRTAAASLAEAEATLLAALGLAGWSPPEPLSYSARAADALTAARLDAQFYAPRIRALLDVLGRDGRTLSDIAKPRRDRFSAKKCDAFHYIEIGDVEGGGGLGATLLDSADAPSRATWHVRKGDVLTSTVRPIRRLSAIVAPEQDRYVASSGFAVLQPTGVTSEVLMTFLRLPAICELMDLYASASMYPAISEGDILGLPVPEFPNEVADAVTAAVQSAFAARARSRALLTSAKRAVEIAIEEGEAAALAHLAAAGLALGRF
jgi:hypothetical protein